MKKTAIVCTVIMVMAAFCTPAFADSGTGNLVTTKGDVTTYVEGNGNLLNATGANIQNSGNGNSATTGTIVGKIYGDGNSMTVLGAQVKKSYDGNIATSYDVTALNGINDATTPVMKAVDYNTVTAIGAQVNNSGYTNSAVMAPVNGTSTGSVTAINTGSSYLFPDGEHVLGNTVSAVGVQVTGSIDGNVATNKGDVRASNSGNNGNTVSATGASIMKSGSGNEATMGAWGVKAINVGSGIPAYEAGEVTGVYTNTVTALGAQVDNSGNNNIASTAAYVNVQNWGTSGNMVSGTGALVSDSYDGNKATAHAVTVEVWPGGHADYANNILNGVGAQVVGSGYNNQAKAYVVFNNVYGAGNAATAIGAQVINSGNGNIATCNTTVRADVHGNGNTVTAIGAQVK